MNYSKLLSFFLLWMPFLACTKTAPMDGPSTQGKGIVRTVGQPIGNLVEKEIGPAGGSIHSEDGRISIEIPAGALNTDVRLAVEPITRTLVDGVENTSLPAFRLLPHGQTFSKPVKINFHFSENEFKTIISNVTKIAYQANDGKWKGIPSSQVDMNTKKVSVNTTHFSDWTVYEGIYLEPTENVSVEINKSVTLKVMVMTPLTLSSGQSDQQEVYLDEPSEIPASVDWRIVGGSNSGTIANLPSRPAANYTAPGSIPTPNPVEVEAKIHLSTQGDLNILKNITILEPIEPGIHLRINGGAWIHFTDTDSFADNESYVASDGNYPYDVHEISLRIAGGRARGRGSWAWDDQPESENSTSFEYIVKKPGPYTSYKHLYTKNNFDIWHVSPGAVRITEYKADQYGQVWATGDFTIESSTPFIEGHSGTPPSAKIVGNFKLKVK